jgi:hypothetical protein
MVPVNSVVPRVSELTEIPIRTGAGPAVLLRDVGYVEDASDILTSYALVDGKRSVYIPVRSGPMHPRSAWCNVTAGCLECARRFRRHQRRARFVQSGYVTSKFGLSDGRRTGAILTGLMVLFLPPSQRRRDLAFHTLLAAIVALWELADDQHHDAGGRRWRSDSRRWSRPSRSEHHPSRSR